MSDGGLHHLHTRKRVYEKLEAFPSPDAFKAGLDHLMYGIALMSPMVLVPQVVQLYTTQSTDGLSLYTWSLLTVINILWTTYSIVHREWPMLISSSLMGFLDIVIVVGILLFS
ncbi:PQ-loop repeat-containing protein [Candidatus Kaiserbacteria bacterium]|nr:PQ-loop repeat-containing protein [Candidatus Kaiserbacteria bacterium]